VLDHNLQASIARAAALAARGACFAARAEMIRALQSMTRSLDAHRGSQRASEALARAMRALQECEDFVSDPPYVDGEPNLAGIVSGHRTPVLHGENVDHWTPLAAEQAYLRYARDQLVLACQCVPAASPALYTVARIYTMIDQAEAAPTLCLPIAVALHQAALAVDPNNGQAGNELGVLLARCGQLEAARQVLQHAASVCPQPETWHNLSIVHQQLGQVDLARRAAAQYEAATVDRGPPASRQAVQSVQWVAPEVFIGGRSGDDGDSASGAANEARNLH
jgi:tetratricopeptide (TPR) repeat protein